MASSPRETSASKASALEALKGYMAGRLNEEESGGLELEHSVYPSGSRYRAGAARVETEARMVITFGPIIKLTSS